MSLMSNRPVSSSGVLAGSRWNLPHPPLILSDVNIPGMSSLELLPKANALRLHVPVIRITAYGDAVTKRKAHEGGAEALLTKPIDFVLLRSKIDTRVERAA